MNDVIPKIAVLVEDACKQELNIFGYGIWTHHISSVVKYSKQLAKELGADEEITEIAALLHDYASITAKGDFEQHNITGAEEAEKILRTFNYPQNKIEQVKHAILAHRADETIQPETIEARCVASADAMAHFDNIPSLFYLGYVRHGKSIDDGAEWLKKKLEGSYSKLMPEAKEMIQDKYDAAMKIL